jgi:hypothetical protein
MTTPAPGVAPAPTTPVYGMNTMYAMPMATGVTPTMGMSTGVSPMMGMPMMGATGVPNSTVGYVNPAAASMMMNTVPQGPSQMGYVNPNYLKMVNQPLTPQPTSSSTNNFGYF